MIELLRKLGASVPDDALVYLDSLPELAGEVVRRNPATLHWVDESGAGVLHQACERGATLLGRELLRLDEAAARRQVEIDGRCTTPLGALLPCLPKGWDGDGAQELVEDLLAAGASATGPEVAQGFFKMVENQGQRHPWLMLRYSNGEPMTCLLEAGVDPNVRNDAGQTPLMFAANAKVAQKLLAYGADPMATDRQLRTPMHHLAAEDDIVALLTAAGALRSARDAAGRTADSGAERDGPLPAAPVQQEAWDSYAE